jgi:hypothetical protein
MSTDHIEGHPDEANLPALRAVPSPDIFTEGQDSPPAVYADVTAPGERKPILPPWLASVDGEDPAQVCRTYFLDVPDAKAVMARARAARERAGTLSGAAVGEDTSGPARDVLADAAACFTGEPALH